jgi:hypothetical protein
MEEKYNGWTNRETWLVALHLSNSEELYNSTIETLKKKVKYSFQKEDDLMYFVETLTNMSFDRNESSSSLLSADLIRTALSRVDWKEIVNSFKEDLKNE